MPNAQDKTTLNALTSGPGHVSTPERTARTVGGGVALLTVVGLLAGAVYTFVQLVATDQGNPLGMIGCIVLAIFTASGFYSLQPNESVAILLFGRYKGTDRTAGLRWVPFWYTRRKLSLRVRNVVSEKLKVNDKRGNPIEIAAVLVWRVSNTAQALFDVESYAEFVDIQIETALREIASHFAYDHSEDEHEPTLRSDLVTVSRLLAETVQERVAVAGVIVDEARLSHLAYAPEIAQVMLRRQQAEAILAAREKIVRGAVQMVESALNDLSERKVVHLDDDRRASMVSNLLVVLCADHEVQPMINTGA